MPYPALASPLHPEKSPALQTPSPLALKSLWTVWDVRVSLYMGWKNHLLPVRFRFRVLAFKCLGVEGGCPAPDSHETIYYTSPRDSPALCQRLVGPIKALGVP